MIWKSPAAICREQTVRARDDAWAAGFKVMRKTRAISRASSRPTSLLDALILYKKRTHITSEVPMISICPYPIALDTYSLCIKYTFGWKKLEVQHLPEGMPVFAHFRSILSIHYSRTCTLFPCFCTHPILHPNYNIQIAISMDNYYSYFFRTTFA